MKKRIFSALTALILAFSLLPPLPAAGADPDAAAGEETPAVSPSSGTFGALVWSLEDGTLTVSGTGPMEDCTGGAPWEEEKTSVAAAVIESGVTSIGAFAFAGCTGLEDVSVPASVTSVGEGAFQDCGGEDGSFTLRFGGTREEWAAAAPAYADIPVVAAEDGDGPALHATVVASGNCGYNNGSNATWAMDSLGTLTISGVGVIGDSLSPEIGVGFATDGTSYTFRNKFKKVVVEEGITRIGDSAFYTCTGVEEIILPSSLKTIGQSALAYTAITTLEIPEGVTSIENSGVHYCTDLTSVTLPSTLTTIGPSAFARCTSLANITIPASVQTIENSAFVTCGMPMDLSSKSGITITYEGTLKQWDKITENYPTIQSANATDNGYTVICTLIAEGYCGAEGTAGENLTWTLNTDGLLTISGTGRMKDYPSPYAPWNAYADQITSVVIEDGVTYIGAWAFIAEKNLQSVSIPSSVTEMGEGVFCNCSGLTSITLPSGITAIPRALFSGCKSLTSVTVPSGVTSIGEEAFYNCAALRGINLEDGLKTIGPKAFSGCHGIEQFDVPSSVTYIGDNVFLNCGSGNQITIVYNGTEEQWNTITEEYTNIQSGVAADNGYTIIFNYEPDPPKPEDPEDPPEDPPEPEPIPDPDPGDPTPNPEPDPTPSRNPDSGSDSDSGSSRPAQVEPVIPSVMAPAAAQYREGDLTPSTEQWIVREETFADWGDRIEPPQYALELYDVLVKGADESGDPGTGSYLTDCLVRDEFFTVDPRAGQDVAEEYEVDAVEVLRFDLLDCYAQAGEEGLRVESFADESFFRVGVSPGDAKVDYPALRLGDVVRTSSFNGVFVTKLPKTDSFDVEKKEVCSYIAAVYQAFDRDHPEIFWLSGKNQVRMMTVKDGSGQTVYFFLSLADKDGFTMRAPAWTGAGAVAEGIRRRDAAVEEILSTVTGTDGQSRLQALNRWLTEHNEYNTTPDLTTIGNEPHECLSALEGRTGTSGPVCDGYSRAFKVLCDRLGIACVLENGYAKVTPSSAGSLHMWNSVQLNGVWYGVDVTWDDPVVKGISGAKSGYESEEYFLVGSETTIRGMTYAMSHPATNQAAKYGVVFSNSPALSEHEYYAGAEVLPFLDVPYGAWFEDAVWYVFENGLMAGVGGTSFAPDGTATRGMVAAILYRMESQPAADPYAFQDILPDSYYAAAAAWAGRAGIMSGYGGGLFGPDDPVTREQLAAILWRYARYKGRSAGTAADLSAYRDAALLSEWAVSAMQWACGAGVVSGFDGLLHPQSACTRAQLAVMLHQFGGLA